MKWEKFIASLEKSLMIIASVALGLGALMVTATTLLRYTLNINYEFMQELPRELLPFTVFLVIGVLLKHRNHITVDMIEMWLKGKARAEIVHRILIGLAVLVVGAMLMWASLETLAAYIHSGEVTTEEIEIPVWLLYLAPCIGFAGLLIFSIEMIVRDTLLLLRRKDSQAIDAE
jgi:TRAP-type C4-dicarboxylate transport system permease small subunit